MTSSTNGAADPAAVGSEKRRLGPAAGAIARGGGVALVCAAFVLLTLAADRDGGGWGAGLLVGFGRSQPSGGGDRARPPQQQQPLFTSERSVSIEDAVSTAGPHSFKAVSTSSMGAAGGCPSMDNAYEQLRRFWRLSGRSDGAAVDEGQGQVVAVVVAANKRVRGAVATPAATPAGSSSMRYPGGKGPKQEVKDYVYRVSTLRNDSEVLVLAVAESRWEGEGKGKRKEVPSWGGASFHVLWEVTAPVVAEGPEEAEAAAAAAALGIQREPKGRTLSLSTCVPTDHFDGNYTICCRPPLNADKGRSRLTVQVFYLDFKAFQSEELGAPLQHIVYEATWGSPTIATAEVGIGVDGSQQQQKEMAAAVPLPPCTGQMLQLAALGEWGEATPGSLRWIDPTVPCVTPISTPAEIARCVADGYDSVTFLGDSHVRQLAEYFGALARGDNDMPAVRARGWGHQDTQVTQQVRFLWSTNGTDLARRIQKDLVVAARIDSRPKTARDVVVMDTAHWDLMTSDVTRFVTEALPAVISALEALRNDPATSGYRLLWVSTFPMPPQFNGGFRSEATAQAADAFLQPHLQRLGIELFPVLPTIRPRAHVVVDDHHWLQDFSAEGKHFGDVGIEIARMLTRHLCAPGAATGAGVTTTAR